MALTTNTALAQLQPSGIRRITAFAKQTPGCILLTLGEPDGNTADAVKEEVAKSLAANETHYPPNNGTVELRRAISAHMEKRNLAYGEDEIIVTCGATEALFAALSSILNPGDEVIADHVGAARGGRYRLHEGNRAHVPEQSHGLRAQPALLGCGCEIRQGA